MKRTFVYPAMIFFVMLTSCQKDPLISFGFDADFGKDSYGLTIMNVNSNAKTIILTGEVVGTVGEVLVELIEPTGDTVFSSTITAPAILDVNESYKAVPGNWKLKYKSIEGEGSIELHLNMIRDN
jgi:hypothetical protein